MLQFMDWVNQRFFRAVHGSSLVYNSCWEDPRIDRAALQLKSTDTIAMITSAGCNALDYALTGVERIHAIDMNYRQNALLELKLAAIRKLDFDDFFSIFGLGRLKEFPRLYQFAIRPQLSNQAAEYWDSRTDYFLGKGLWPSFYFRGTSGWVARAIKTYVDRKPIVRESIDSLFNAESLEQQSSIYQEIKPYFWTRMLKWVLGRDSTLALLGVPRAQRLHVERHYPGGIAKFIEDCVETVFAKLPIHDNYFWRLYVYGQYSPECCPEYLKESNFARLKAGLVDSIQTHTCTMGQFLREFDGTISRYVLLDHMDWLNTPSRLPILIDEWQAILDRSSEDARVIWRSGGLDGKFVDPLRVVYRGMRRRLGDMLNYFPEQAAALHARDRVHTYGSFCIADVVQV